MPNLTKYDSEDTAFTEQSAKEHIRQIRKSIESCKGSVPVIMLLTRKHFSGIDKSSQISYYHFLQGYPVEFTTAVVTASPAQIRCMKNAVVENFVRYAKTTHDYINQDIIKAQKDYDLIMNEKISDEDLSLRLEEDLAAVKITRVFARCVARCGLQIIK